MNKKDYHELRNKLNFEQNIWPNIAVLILDILLLFLAFELCFWSTIGYICAQFIFVIVFFHGFTLLHECGHGNFSKNERLNTIFGHITSVLCFMPYYSWKYIHTEHHVWAGNLQKDPTLKLIRDYSESHKIKNWVIRFVWRAWLPLLALMQHLVLWTYPYELYKAGKTKKTRNCLISIGILFVSYIILLPMTLKYIIPALIIYLVLVELINFPHHMGTDHTENKLPLWKQNEVTRSCYYPPNIASLLFLNFNFHIEHHLFPDLPWFRLLSARSLIRENIDYRETMGINWNIENRTKDAGEVFLK